MKKSKSPKSPKFTGPTATYVIVGHGTMLTSMLGSPSKKKYFAITIPENVELYTFDDLGKCVPVYETEADFICKNYRQGLARSLSPAFQFMNEHGEINKFPELFLTPDNNTPAQAYSGITHCIPENSRTSGSRKKEIIYNIDAKNTKNCECSSIVPNYSYPNLPYNCDKTYSNYYKRQLRGYKYDPTSTINACGPILMSEAVKLIKAHYNTYYEPNCVIKIYIFACLVEMDLKALVESNRRAYIRAKQLVNPPTSLCTTMDCDALERFFPGINPTHHTPHIPSLPTNSVYVPSNSVKEINMESLSKEQVLTVLDLLKSRSLVLPKEPQKEPQKAVHVTPNPLVQVSKINAMNYYYEVSQHNTLTKVDHNNVVENLTYFKATPLIKSHLSKHRFGYESKEFEFITYKDAFMEFTTNLHAQVSGPPEKKVEKLEKKYRTHDRMKLAQYLKKAVIKIKMDNSGDDPDILPKFNTIKLVRPFIINASSEELINAIYEELKELIALEKEKKTAQGLKTLRKKGKKDKKPKSHKKPKKIIH